MTERPSFLKEVLAAAWLTAKISIPLAAWIAGVVWLAPQNVIAMDCIAYGGILAAMILLCAYWNYKWKRERFGREAPSPETPPRLAADFSVARKKPAFTRRYAPAHMPLDFLQPEPRKLSDLPAGEHAYVSFTAISVDLDGAAWVDIEARLYEREGLSNVKVRLVDKEGYVSDPSQMRPQLVSVHAETSLLLRQACTRDSDGRRQKQFVPSVLSGFV